MSQNHFVTNLATEFFHHSSDEKKNPPKKHLTLGKRRCKMVARDVHKTCNKNEAIAYYVTLHVSFGLMNLCGKTF